MAALCAVLVVLLFERVVLLATLAPIPLLAVYALPPRPRHGQSKIRGKFEVRPRQNLCLKREIFPEEKEASEFLGPGLLPAPILTTWTGCAHSLSYCSLLYSPRS